MRTIRRHLTHTSMLGLGLGLAACAGQPFASGLRSAPSARFSSNGAASHAARLDADTTAAPPTEERRYASVEELLEGRIAGVSVFRRPDGTVSMRVRGLTSSFTDAEPLVVVDGTMLSTASQSDMMASLSGIQIRKIEVLKDVAATSIYGSRGSHGVVSITTRHAAR
jgi:TonB-dependent SusC/RagA subfamily outer membrane receptor